MSYIRNFTSISINTNDNVVQINDNVSNFSIKENSQLFIEGYSVPVTVVSSDTQARTLTLSENWSNPNVVGTPAKIIPLGDPDVYSSAVEANRAAYDALIEAINNPAGDLQPAVEAALEYLYTQVAQSAPVEKEENLSHRLIDYPTYKPTEELPTESPNDKRLMLFDNVRGLFHVAFTDRWFTVPTNLESRRFAIFYRGLILRFKNNNAYSGSIKMRVYPMGNGGLGLPNNPTLANHQWHVYETTIAEEDPLYKIGEFGSQYFEGIIDYVQLETGWQTFDTDMSDCSSLNASFDTAFGTLKSPFKQFHRRADGFWYSEDMMPTTPNAMGASWAQDPNNPRVFTVTGATSGTDALRFFGDAFDEFQFELILDVSYVSGTLALTVSNSDPNKVYYPGPARFITDERIYFKRAGSEVTAALTVESIKMRIPHYE